MGKVLFDRIEELHVKMRELTLASGVTVEVYDTILQVDSEISHTELKKRLDFLDVVHKTEYFAVLEIWRLLPPEIWKRYQDFGETSLREQLLLRERQKQLRRSWRKYQQENPRGKAHPVDDKDQANPTTICL